MNLLQKNYCDDAYRHFQSGDNRMAQVACCYAGVEFEAAKRAYDEAADMARFVEEMELEAERKEQELAQKAASLATPDACFECPFFVGENILHTRVMYCECKLLRKLIPDEDKERPDWCPLGKNREGMNHEA